MCAPLQRLQQASVAKMVGKASTIGEDGVLRVRASAFACQLVHLDYITITGPILSITGPSSPSPAPPLHHRPMLSITGPFSPSPTPSLHHWPLLAPPPVSGPRPAPYPIPLSPFPYSLTPIYSPFPFPLPTPPKAPYDLISTAGTVCHHFRIRNMIAFPQEM